MTASKRNNVKVSGKGNQAMVFAHGFGCDQSMWRFMTPAFENDYRIVLFDHVGAGGSDISAYRRDKYGDLRGYADDVLEILRELDLRDVIFVGHSVSAMIGLLASIKEPARFDKLVLVGPSPCYFNDGSYVGGFRREDLVAMLGQAENDFAAWARAMGPAIMGTPDRPALGQELADSFCRTDPKIAVHFARVIFLSDNRADLARVTTPSLILQCSQDIVAPESVGRFMHAKMPGSELKILEAIGHCPHVSAPEETIEAVKTWLAAGRAQPLKRSA